MQNCPPVLLTALVVGAYVQPSGLSRLPSLALQMPNSPKLSQAGKGISLLLTANCS